MKIQKSGILLLLALLFGCVTDPVAIPVDQILDELEDRTEHVGSLVIDGSSFRGNPVAKILVNGEDTPVNAIQLGPAGFYRIEIFLEGHSRYSPETVRIVILDPERGNTEWGLPPWTPVDPDRGSLGNQTVSLLHAPAAPQHMDVPMVVVLRKELCLSDTYLDATLGSSSFRIKRGVGSVQVTPGSRGQALRLDAREFVPDIAVMDTPPLTLSGELSSDLHLEAGTYAHIPSNLAIPTGITLSIDSGCFISVGPGVNIYHEGQVLINGTSGAPVTITCSEGDTFWGGFIGKSAGNKMEATHAIFSRSGYHTGGEYAYGHAGRQALFYSEDGELKLDHCYMIDHIGQVFYPVSGTLELRSCLVQRVKTGGQLNGSELVMDRCVFTDFPDDSFDYRDEDNDGLYLDGTNAVITNSVFMFAKDDGLDSGASGGGEILISNTVFESVFHEGAALSSGHSSVKLHRITNCLFYNCGQGLELGYSSPNHQVFADSCRFIGNGVGIRYGDCYDFPHHGYIHVSNSESLDNTYHDVWNMNREHWEADTAHMSFDQVLVSEANPMYPELILKN